MKTRLIILGDQTADIDIRKPEGNEEAARWGKGLQGPVTDRDFWVGLKLNLAFPRTLNLSGVADFLPCRF
jgi:hypothetical protein